MQTLSEGGRHTGTLAVAVDDELGPARVHSGMVGP